MWRRNHAEKVLPVGGAKDLLSSSASSVEECSEAEGKHTQRQQSAIRWGLQHSTFS